VCVHESSYSAFMDTQQLLNQLDQSKQQRRRGRRRRFTHSRLDRYRGELTVLRNEGKASYADLAHWLRQNRRIVVTPSTIWRRFKRWEEDG